MNIDVFILCRNEEEILPYTLRHYLSFARRIFVFEGRSTDGSRAVLQEFQIEHNEGEKNKGWPKHDRINIIDWPQGMELNDEENSLLKSTCWIGTDADWVICVDCDELIHFPGGVQNTLGELFRKGISVVSPIGWELLSDVFPTTTGQIYDEVKFAAPDSRWYGKPVLFRPSGVKAARYSVGAHEGRFALSDGRRIYADHRTPRTVPEVWLLHCKHLGSVERVGSRYNDIKKSYSKKNIDRRWGFFEDGIRHAQSKRDMLLPQMQRIFY